jgi:hypothetical protein
LKHGKKPTRKQASLISTRKLNYKNWLVIKDKTDVLEIVNRGSRKIRTIVKGV